MHRRIYKIQSNIYNGVFLQKSSIVDVRLVSKHAFDILRALLYSNLIRGMKGPKWHMGKICSKLNKNINRSL